MGNIFGGTVSRGEILVPPTATVVDDDTNYGVYYDDVSEEDKVKFDILDDRKIKGIKDDDYYECMSHPRDCIVRYDERGPKVSKSFGKKKSKKSKRPRKSKKIKKSHKKSKFS